MLLFIVDAALPDLNTLMRARVMSPVEMEEHRQHYLLRLMVGLESVICAENMPDAARLVSVWTSLTCRFCPSIVSPSSARARNAASYRKV